MSYAGIKARMVQRAQMHSAFPTDPRWTTNHYSPLTTSNQQLTTGNYPTPFPSSPK
jgi:hypothetical protein